MRSPPPKIAAVKDEAIEEWLEASRVLAQVALNGGQVPKTSRDDPACMLGRAPTGMAGELADN
jgi:hypothetical protein